MTLVLPTMSLVPRILVTICIHEASVAYCVVMDITLDLQLCVVLTIPGYLQCSKLTSVLCSEAVYYQ